MMRKGKKLGKEERENLIRAAEQPVPRPPIKVIEVKAKTRGLNGEFLRESHQDSARHNHGSPVRTFLNQSSQKAIFETGSHLPKGVAWGIAGVVVLFFVGFIVSLVMAKYQIARSISTHSATLSAGIKDLQNFDPQGAEQEFAALGIATSEVQGPMGAIGLLFRGGSGALASVADLSRQLALLPQEYVALQADIFRSSGPSTSLPQQDSGQVESSSPTRPGASSTLSADLNALRDTVDALDNDTDQMSSGITPFGSGSVLDGRSYVALKSELHGTRQFLDEFAPWVATSTPRHVLVLFQNSAELRPGGGFLGSYADVTVADGAIEAVAVYDVADVDAGFAQNIVPPLPLQPEISRFRPADTNWFFDFPTSASKSIAFFEQSSLYSSTTPQASPITFDGVVAISPNVLRDLLSATGPVTVSVSSTVSRKSASTTFTADNFLVQIQKLVQDGQAQSSTYPKQVLRNLTDEVFLKLASSTDEERQGLLGTALDWVGKKDVTAYFKDAAFENFLVAYGAAGDVYAAPQNFNGDYLAAVDANVNGGKSDLYVSSTVTWQSQIGADGMIDDSVIIDRAHNGNTSPYWWYQVTNQDYLELFVPDGSTLTNENGGFAKKITPKVNYVKLGYAVDSTVATIESSTEPLFSYPVVAAHEESGKKVFATWSKVASGAKTELSFEYSHHAFSLPAVGVAYQFVFEKQASTARHYSFEFDAPLGYQFAENKLPSYHYESDDPPGRMIVTLTLENI